MKFTNFDNELEEGHEEAESIWDNVWAYGSLTVFAVWIAYLIVRSIFTG